MSKSWTDIQNAPVKEMRKLKLDLGASKRIRDDNGLAMFSVTGNQQSGKSAYGLMIMHEIYNGNVDEILSHVVMSAKDFAAKINEAITGEYRMKAIMWDDQSTSGSAASWMVDPKFVMALGALGDTMAVAVKGVILTSPTGNMTKAFRDYSKYKVQIHQGNGKFGRIARGYWIGTSPMEQRNCSLVFQDNYDVRIPFYERYAEKRREISIAAVQNLMKMTQEQDNDIEIVKPLTIKQRSLEIRRDIEAGVYGDKSARQVCKEEEINYETFKGYR